MISQNLEDLIEVKRAPEEKRVFVDNSLLKRFSDYVEAGYRDGIFGLSRYKHDKGTIGKLSRFLSIKHKKTCTVQDFNEVMLMEFREFVQNEFEGVNKYIPICETSSSKLARSTHVDMMNKVQINIYAAGLHRQSSGAVTHYTMLELADRFKLMNLAFDQEDYKVDKNLEVI